MQKIIESINSIINDPTKGAWQIERDIWEKLRHLSISDQFLADLLSTISTNILEKHPSMANLLKMVNDLWLIYEDKTIENKISSVKNLASKRIAEVGHRLAAVASNTLEVVKDKTIIATISRSGTVIETIKYLHYSKITLIVLVSESRPMNEGYFTAEEISKAGIETYYFTDVALGAFLRNDRFIKKPFTKDFKWIAVTGIDALTPTIFLNKVGTYQLMIAAKESYKTTIALLTDDKILPSNMEPLLGITSEQSSDLDAPEGVTPINFYFESIPLEIIDYYITDSGIYTPSEIRNKAINRNISNFLTQVIEKKKCQQITTG